MLPDSITATVHLLAVFVAMRYGRHMDDGVTHYKGNYGNLLFFWDVVFGSA